MGVCFEFDRVVVSGSVGLEANCVDRSRGGYYILSGRVRVAGQCGGEGRLFVQEQTGEKGRRGLDGVVIRQSDISRTS